MTEKLSGQDPAWAVRIRLALKDWEKRALVAPGWTVEWDGGDGAYRVAFSVLVTWPGGAERRYSMTEAEFCQYVLGVADLAPEVAGRAALELAAGAREEAP